MIEMWKCCECKTLNPLSFVDCSKCNKQRWLQLGFDRKVVEELIQRCNFGVSPVIV